MRFDEIVDNSVTHKLETLVALRRFRDLRTWKPENAEQRLAGMQELVNELINVYGLNVSIPLETDLNPFEAMFGGPRYTSDGIPVYPIGVDPQNLSIISLLHSFAGIRSQVSEFQSGHTFVGRQRWAINLFKKIYPTCFSRLYFNEATGWFTRAPQPTFEMPYVHLMGTQPPVEMFGDRPVMEPYHEQAPPTDDDESPER